MLVLATVLLATVHHSKEQEPANAMTGAPSISKHCPALNSGAGGRPQTLRPQPLPPRS